MAPRTMVMMRMRRRNKMTATETFMLLWTEPLPEQSWPGRGFSGSWAEEVLRNDYRGKMFSKERELRFQREVESSGCLSDFTSCTLVEGGAKEAGRARISGGKLPSVPSGNTFNPLL